MAQLVSKEVLQTVLNAIAQTMSTKADKTQVQELANAVANIHSFEVQIVDAVPTTYVDHVIYFVPSTNGTGDSYDEYMKVGNALEKIGNTDIDLSNYYTKGQVDSALGNKVDKVSGKGLSTNDYTTTEKNKLAGIANNANNYSHPTYTSKTSGLYKITVDGTGHVSGTTAVTKADITGLGIPSTNTTYVDATTSASGLMSASDKTKLNGIASGAEVNQNAFSNVKVGETTISADAKQDTLELVAGTNITLTPDATNDKVTITAKDTTYNVATTSANGLMSSGDKSKLDGIASGANKYTHPSYTAKTSGLYKITVDATGHVSGTTAVAKADITALGIPAQDTVYTLPNAGTSLGGVKSGGDVTISNGVITVNDDSHNHVIGNVDGLQGALDGKVNVADIITDTAVGTQMWNTALASVTS